MLIKAVDFGQQAILPSTISNTTDDNTLCAIQLQFRPASMPGPSTAESDERKKATTADKKERTDGNNSEPIVVVTGRMVNKWSTENVHMYDTLPLPGPSTAESDEGEKATTADKKERTDGNNSEPTIIEPGTWSSMNGQRFSTKNADQYDTTLDTLSDVCGEPVRPADNLCPADDHQSKDNHQNEGKPVEEEKQEEAALETDDVDAETNNTSSDAMKTDKSEEEESSEEDGEDEQQDESDGPMTGDHDNSSDAGPSLLKRRVSNLMRTFFGVPKAEEEHEEDEEETIRPDSPPLRERQHGWHQQGR